MTFEVVAPTPTRETTCPDCEGGGWVAKLYPSGHAEVTCDNCAGTGKVEEFVPNSPLLEALQKTDLSGTCTCGGAIAGSGHSSWCDSLREPR